LTNEYLAKNGIVVLIWYICINIVFKTDCKRPPSTKHCCG
jgi:hypothetical protein